MISGYTSLIGVVADWLNRSDLSDRIPTFIQLAEAALNRDPRLRRMQRVRPFVVDSETAPLPVDFKALIAPLIVIGGGAVHVTTPGSLEREMEEGPGQPTHAAVLGRETLLLSPAPDEEYELALSYWGGLSPTLSVGVQSNWVLVNHPDLYLYAALVESAPYLKDDPRLGVWRSELEGRLEQLHLSREDEAYSGGMVEPGPSRAIGG